MTRRRGALLSLAVGTLCLLVAVWWFATRRDRRTQAPPAVAHVEEADAAPRAGRRPPPRPGQPDASQAGTVEPTGRRVISGVVLRRDRSPAAGALVLVGESLRAGEDRLRGDIEIITGEDGRFRVEVDRDRGMAVIASHAEGWSGLELIESSDEDATLELVLDPPASIGGRVLHAGKPVPDVRVALTPGRPGLLTASTRTDAAGAFRFAPVVPGPYHVGANPVPPKIGGAGGWTYVDVALAPGEALSMTVDLPADILLVMSAELQEGEDDITWSLRDASGKVLRDLPVGPVRGPAAFRDLAPGAYQACVAQKGAEPRCAALELAPTPPVQTVTIP